MKRLLAVFAVMSWALVARGQDAVQTLVGLPEYGVTLTGTVQNPTIVNNSGKTIIGHVLCLEYASGGGQCRRNLKTRGLRLNMKNLSAGIPPGGTESPMSPSPDSPAPAVTVRGAANGVIVYGPNLTPPTFARVVLDVVVFADGQFVGPDEGHNFEGMANQVIAEQALAEQVSHARNDPAQREAVWAEVARLVQPPGKRPLPQDRPLEFSVEWAQALVARDLNFAKNRSGEAAAYDVADRELSIPMLWRAQR